jgi:hypothetical protein
MSDALPCKPRAILDQLDIPDCDCVESTDPEEILRLHRENGPCAHIKKRDHGLSLDEWTELQRLLCPEEYFDPPPSPAPVLALTREARVETLRQRAQHDPPLDLWHPKIFDAEQLDALGLDCRRERNGAPVFGALREARRAA